MSRLYKYWFRSFTVIGQISLALRRHYDPAMFEPENLARILCPEKYEYVLDRWVFHSSSSFCWQSQCNIIVFVFPGIVSNMNLTIPYIFELFLWSTATCLNLEALTPLLQQGFIWSAFGTSLDLSVLQALWADGFQLVLEQAARWIACSSGGERQVAINSIWLYKNSKLVKYEWGITEWVSTEWRKQWTSLLSTCKFTLTASWPRPLGWRWCPGRTCWGGAARINLTFSVQSSRFCEIEALKTGKISMAVAKLVEERAQKQRLRQSHGAKWE